MNTTTELVTELRVRVWDPLVRLLHWALVVSLVAGWFTRHARGEIHEWVGYAALVVVAIRVAWGFLGTPYARFGQFVRGPGAARVYLASALAGRAPRYLGHNPLGGWMTVTLLSMIFLVCLTGWMYTTDRFWGIAWVGDLHLWLTWCVIGLVALHLCGVIWTSLKSRENLVAAMFHGHKAPPSGTDQA